MESACRATAECMCFCALCIPYSAVVMVLALSFYTEDPDIVGYALNYFLFPEISLSSGSEASLLTRRWDSFLVYDTFTSFADMGSLLGLQKVVPVSIWDAASKQLELWTGFCAIFLGDASNHPSTQEM